ncbi:MAG: DUF3427 domain-containing protein [bacterium]
MSCPFCVIPPERILYEDDLVAGIWDAFPVSPGHVLLITRRHVSHWFEATQAERAAFGVATARIREIIFESHRPDGFNIGTNVGPAAGQTVEHLHVHVIPRYAGDVADPRGGVRHVIPDRANYLASTGAPYATPWLGKTPHARALVSGGSDDPLLPHLIAHFDQATAVDIAVAFTLESGVRLLQPHLNDLLGRGGRVRIITGDYLGVTEPDALVRLTDLQGDVNFRIFESAGVSFHPKAYIIAEGIHGGTAFVGSSNLSETALQRGHEWNVRTITPRDVGGFAEITSGFERLFAHPKSKPLDLAWIEAYRRRRVRMVVQPSGVAPEAAPPPPEPHAVQREALAALDRTRADGTRAGLVVLATGLGKTWLSAFDSNRPEFARVLFVAHREEILAQALQTFRSIRPSAILGSYTGTEKTSGADVLFASIQTLGHARHLERFDRDQFDYIVVDEFHHAAASTYRRLIEYFRPQFLLGLTATPERTDGGDLLALCGENLVYRCDLVDGIRRGLLSPFDYFGVPDDVDYSNIPWRSNRFDPEELTAALATNARAQNALEQHQQKAGERTLAFCASKRHADFMATYFVESGRRAVAVHSGPTSAPRVHSLELLVAGDLDVVFAVDMFNEGVDLPLVDTIMMLRPTESQIIWMQQFGRGLRWQQGKRLRVIDYIGNHRSFLIKPRTLLQLAAGDASVAYALDELDAGTFELPPGCSVTYELEAKDILRSLLRKTGRGEALRDYYTDFSESHGARPLAVEAYHDGQDPKSARPSHPSWLSFVRAMGGLTDEQVVAHDRFGALLDALETTPMTKSFKMVILLAMLADDAFPGEMAIDSLVARFADVARRYALVRTEIGDVLDDPERLRQLVEEDPIAAWAGGRGTGGTAFFSYDGSRFATTFPVPPESRSALQELVREIVDWRLAVYLRRVGAEGGADRIVCRVSHAGGKPILFYSPGRDRVGGIPEGWREVTIDGEQYQANFVKIAVNVVVRVGSGENVLPDILTRWFGATAGQPGTSQFVLFSRSSDGYTLEPLGERSSSSGPELWKAYKRSDIAERLGVKLVGREPQSGIVTRPKLIVLFVTIDKSGMAEEHRYQDQFVSPNEFQWQSQNRTAQSSEFAQRLRDHVNLGIRVHLCVRARAKVNGVTMPFVYCGELAFVRWEGEKPITVWWRLRSAVPANLREKLGIKS